jgi:endonuclease/exonuclease/phosphatase family metal-dependent hydrolase
MTDQLRLATWNIHKGIGTDRCYALDRTIDVLRSIDADVVCLQEVDENVARSGFDRQARRLAKELGYPEVALGLNVAVGGGHYGNCTLSRRPVRTVVNVDLTFPFKKRRSGLVTRIEGGDGWDWVVANVHLGLLHLERRRQVRSLLDHLLSEATPKDAVVIAGDWNDWGNRLHRQVVAEEGFHIARLPDHREAGLKTFPSRAPVAALDKILYRDPLSVRHVLCPLDARTRCASDHLPLVAELHVHGRPHAPERAAAAAHAPRERRARA